MLREFGALPGEERVRRMTDGEYLWCLLHMALDEEEALATLCPPCQADAQEGRCPACGEPTGAWVGEENSGFDRERYERMRGGEEP